jgi:transposase
MIGAWRTIQIRCPPEPWWTLRISHSQSVGGGSGPRSLKRQMIAETLEPGASVSIVARRHDVNTNQLFKWRRELLPKAVPAVFEGSTMVPVEIAAEQPRHRRRADRKGIIEIEFGSGARVSLRGEVVPAVLRQVIELLR